MLSQIRKMQAQYLKQNSEEDEQDSLMQPMPDAESVCSINEQVKPRQSSIADTSKQRRTDSLHRQNDSIDVTSVRFDQSSLVSKKLKS